MFIEILFKMLLFKGGVLIYAEHCVYIYIYIHNTIYISKHFLQCLGSVSFFFMFLMEVFYVHLKYSKKQ